MDRLDKIQRPYNHFTNPALFFIGNTGSLSRQHAHPLSIRCHLFRLIGIAQKRQDDPVERDVATCADRAKTTISTDPPLAFCRLATAKTRQPPDADLRVWPSSTRHWRNSSSAPCKSCPCVKHDTGSRNSCIPHGSRTRYSETRRPVRLIVDR